MPKKGFIPNKPRPWVDARKLDKLTHTHVQMAHDLGMTPKSLGEISPNKSQLWKAPLARLLGRTL